MYARTKIDKSCKIPQKFVESWLLEKKPPSNPPKKTTHTHTHTELI